MTSNSTLSVTYSQIYIEDYTCSFHFHSHAWHDEEVESMLCVGRNFLILGTVSSIQVPFFFSVLKNEPEIDLSDWDHINKCSIEIESGLLISGDFDTESEMLRISLDKGVYGVFVCYKGLNTISQDGLAGDDSYHVFLWPTAEHIPKQVVKTWRR